MLGVLPSNPDDTATGIMGRTTLQRPMAGRGESSRRCRIEERGGSTAGRLLVLGLLACGVLAVGIVGPGLMGIDDPDRPSARLAPADPGETTYNGSHGQLTSSAVAIAIHAEVNDVREAAGKPAISWNATLASVSRAHSGDMATRGYVAHESPDGATLLDRYEEVTIDCATFGETIAHTYVDTPVNDPNGSTDQVTYRTAEGLAAGIVTEWLHSPPHRKTILTPDQPWTAGGVGVYLTESGQVYVTHNFCAE